MHTIYFVIPCYNEEEVIFETAKQLLQKMNLLMDNDKINTNSRIVFVDDGSKDKTWDMIETMHRDNPIFKGIKLSRNKGHQNALLAGLLTVKDQCDAVISLDADLQDDINAIDEMVERFCEGYDVVYGVRSKRDTDTFVKRFTAQAYYRLLKLLGVDIVYNHADYRLLSSRVITALQSFKEVNLFLRGLVPMLGFKSTNVSYERKERFAGESKYPFKKMLAFAFEGITSLSVKPIRLITALGFIIFTVSIIMLVYFLVRHYLGETIQGWTSIAVSVWAIGGLQLLAIGVVGEYIGKIYLETKSRPKYIIEKYL